jgi:uncharacterized protein (DUF169 family)
MAVAKEDFTICNKLNFDVPPVGVKFLTHPPDDIARLDENLAFCEMLKKAQQGHLFFAETKDHGCEAGLYVLGQADAPEPFISGQFGAGLQIYESPRVASRLYLQFPKLEKNVVNVVAFAPVDKLTFEPDLLILLADARQTEILLRATSYKNGKIWTSKFAPAIGCAWMYIYPYLTGEVNYFVTGLGHGMKRRNLFPEGRQMISIPFDRISDILQTLQEMPWILPAYKPDGMAFVKQLLVELGMLRDE